MTLEQHRQYQREIRFEQMRTAAWVILWLLCLVPLMEIGAIIGLVGIPTALLAGIFQAHYAHVWHVQDQARKSEANAMRNYQESGYN